VYLYTLYYVRGTRARGYIERARSGVVSRWRRTTHVARAINGRSLTAVTSHYWPVREGVVGIAGAGSRVLPRRSSSRVALRPRRVASERARSTSARPPSTASSSPLLLLRSRASSAFSSSSFSTFTGSYSRCSCSSSLSSSCSLPLVRYWFPLADSHEGRRQATRYGYRTTSRQFPTIGKKLSYMRLSLHVQRTDRFVLLGSPIECDSRACFRSITTIALF